MENLEYTDATPADSALVGWTVLTAMGLEAGRFSRLEEVVKREDTLYSWKNARIAVCGGRKAGCLIAYPGNEYAAMRDRTWKMLSGLSDEELGAMEPEAFPGEYYLDSLAVLPEFRGLGIGGGLVRDALGRASRMGFGSAALICEAAPHHDALRRYYSTLGFHEYAGMTFSGIEFKRMRCPL
ncbi:MAG: GNAT family N-acetyltransferase [Candidatus Cryptobacteroides sp.]